MKASTLYRHISRWIPLLSAILLLASISRAEETRQVLLWPEGPQGSEGKSGRGTIRLHEGRERIISNVHEPSMTVYLPETGIEAGAGIVIFPGGGHRELWSEHEGHNIAKWLNERGVAAFVVYYRLAREKESTYSIREHALADAHRAMRMAKNKAAEWRVDPSRIGIMGFSAGGELVALAGSIYDDGDLNAKDPLEHESSKPAFQIYVYPGGTMDVQPENDAPPAFLVSGHEDRQSVADAVTNLYQMFKKVGVSAEVHIYADTGHGFGLRERNVGPSSKWLERLHEWMDLKGFLHN